MYSYRIALIFEESKYSDAKIILVDVGFMKYMWNITAFLKNLESEICTKKKKK